jgi:hypothetical protein
MQKSGANSYLAQHIDSRSCFRLCRHEFLWVYLMTYNEAIERAQELLHLVGKEFKLPDGETEQIKTVVAWDEGNGNWQPHVCFYDWAGESEKKNGEISHMNVDKFLKTYNILPEPGK